MSIKNKFSSEVFHARHKMGLTQAQVAEAVSISVRWFQHIEKGDALPSAELTLRLIAFLEIEGKNLKEASPDDPEPDKLLFQA